MKVKKITLAAMFTALYAVCAWINIPLPVPFTLQTFAVFLACMIVGGKTAAVSLAVYIMLGAAGLPVFSGFRGGIGIIIGPTGGYIMGFPILCLVYTAVTRIMKSGYLSKLAGALSGLILLYIFGTVWFVFGYTGIGGITFAAATIKCVIPFIIPDIIKLILALSLSGRIKNYTGIIN